MSRSGYNDDIDNWDLIRWRGQVASTIKGKRGQAFLRELAESLDALPERKLIAGDLRKDGAVCAIGSVGAGRGIDLESLDPENHVAVADAFGISRQLVQEIEYLNDEAAWYSETPEKRWERMREWVRGALKDPP